MDPEKFYKAQCLTALQMKKITATEYRHGAIVNGWPSRWPLASNAQKGKRGIIRSMSPRSMIRAAFQIANSPVDFDLMTVLTFRDPHPNPKECLRKWCLRMELNRPTGNPWGWAMEFQKRDVVHYHIMHTLAALLPTWPREDYQFSTVRRRGQERQVLQGNCGRFMQDEWIRIVGDTSSEFLRFQRGGITELMTNPELTARYLGGYIGKLAQKQLPDSEPPQGRWWWLSEAARPVPGKVHVLEEWPLDKPHHLVHDKKKLGLDLDPGAAAGPQNLNKLSSEGLAERRHENPEGGRQ